MKKEVFCEYIFTSAKMKLIFFPIIQIYEKLIEMANMYQNLRTIIMIENTSGICRDLIGPNPGMRSELS